MNIGSIDVKPVIYSSNNFIGVKYKKIKEWRKERQEKVPVCKFLDVI